MTKLIRTMMMTPADNAEMIEKASRAVVDACTLDLEDGTHATRKEAGRKIAADAIASLDWGPRSRGVRANPMSTSMPEAVRDIDAIVSARPDYIMLAKVESADEVVEAAALIDSLGGTDIELWSMIETARAVQEIDAIAQASSRLTTVIFGGGDYSADMGFKRNGLNQHGPISHMGRQLELQYARSRVITSARAYGLRAIDSPCLDVHDAEETYQSALYSFQFGFDGVNILAPRQAPQVHEAYAPSADDLAWAESVLAEFATAGGQDRTVTTVGGEMVDGPFVRSAQAIVNRQSAIGDWEKLFETS